MGDALSQDQIDALLNSAFSGEVIETKKEDKNEIKEYDFRAPKKVTKERMKILDKIFENYARLLSSYFTGLIRMYCKVTIASIEEQKYFEFNNALPDYVMMGIVDLEIDHPEIDDAIAIIQLSNSLSFMMIDRLLGGKGEYKDSDRDFTEIEVSIMHKIILAMSKMLKEPWASYISLTPVLDKIETNSRVISEVGYEDVMMIVALEITIADTKTIVSICIPAVNLDEIMSKFSLNSNRAAKRGDAAREIDRKEHIMSGISYSALDVTAELATTNLDMYDVINLQVNDIIPLGKSIDSNILIKIGEKSWFDGKMGILNGKKAVKIENVIGMEP